MTFSGNRIKFALVADSHIGSVYYRPEYWEAVVAECKRQKVRRCLHVGDVTEGLSNRTGHIFELTHIGFERQREYAIAEWSKFDGEIDAIDGNHDRWYLKLNGALIVPNICGSAEAKGRWHFLGHDEGDMEINGVSIKLWHGEDGSSYAVSYRIQKICESLTGGEKPHVLLLGHVHKATYLFERNIHCVSAGCISRQSKWMRGKRIAAHMGWWMIEMVVGADDVKSFAPTFYPFFS